jgi:GNAT superfamily N-acetyltransferase
MGFAAAGASITSVIPSLLKWYRERSAQVDGWSVVRVLRVADQSSSFEAVRPSLTELAEDTTLYLAPRPTFETVERDGYVYIAGQRSATVHRVRLGDLPAAVEWTRAESKRRGHRDLTWWVGDSATPADILDRLPALGVVVDAEEPVLTGMVATSPPPGADGVEVRPVETLEDYLAALEIDWDVWGTPEAERVERRVLEAERFEPTQRSGVVHHFSAFLDDRRVGFGRAIHMETAVALFGGSVLPDARGKGVYRALVRARWEHAVARGTPTLVVQAGAMSSPVLAGLGFQSYGGIHLMVDRL